MSPRARTCRYNATMVHRSMSKSQFVYYDADCRFCASLARWLSKADVLHQITWAPYQSLDRPPSGLSWEDLERSAYLVDESNDRRWEGFHAFRMLTVRLPLLFPLALFFWFPGASVIGAAVYRRVARNRDRIFGCGVPATGRGDGEELP